ncbi:hypothetical protein BKA81DRAFT_362300 [Phyllosticta paracitricarpa]|uniref:Uncharacterized protein n=1 Tax=Phyllosticta paracitricarpa TaxID=2016321 RepID=A0ABR1NEG4_9PEZI
MLTETAVPILASSRAHAARDAALSQTPRNDGRLDGRIAAWLVMAASSIVVPLVAPSPLAVTHRIHKSRGAVSGTFKSCTTMAIFLSPWRDWRSKPSPDNAAQRGLEASMSAPGAGDESIQNQFAPREQAAHGAPQDLTRTCCGSAISPQLLKGGCESFAP